MSKVLTDQIEKRTGGTAIDVPATGKWPQGNIADDAVGTAQLSATGTASATTFLRGDGSWQSADPAVDSIVNTQIKSDAAIAQTKLANVSKWTSSATAPTSPAPANGDQWYDTSSGKLKVYVSTATPAAWQDVNANYGDFSATGGTETTVGAYTVHTFTSSGNFVATGTKDIEVMIVGGGGSGGGRHGGGGGGGGVVINTAQSVTTGTYAIVIGAGAANPSPVTSMGTNGSNSTGFTMTAMGGGGGGIYPNSAGNVGTAGGSGGGGLGNSNYNAGGASNQQSSGTPTGGTITAYGNAGGDGGYQVSGDHRQSGGGGGAGAAGETPPGPAPWAGGAGGAGLQNNYDGNNYYYGAGGGGGMYQSAGPTGDGGDGGIGGGGGGGTGQGSGPDGSVGAGGGSGQNSGDPGNLAPTGAGGDAGANTGSGGGGNGQGGASGYTGGGGAGGSGIVIIRY